MNAEEQLKQMIIERSNNVPSGDSFIFQDFFLFRKGNAVGAAIPTDGNFINIHNVHPGQSYLLEGDNDVPRIHGNFLTLTVDLNATDLTDPVKAEAFSNMVLQFTSTANGNREALLTDPWGWAEKIIEMGGDKTVQTRPYPYIAEIYLAAELKKAGLLTNLTNEYCAGEANRHDFELSRMSLEVKSHLHASPEETPGELVVSSATQLSRTAGKPLFVVYFEMERHGNLTLESCVADFPDDRRSLLQKLARNGFVEGDFSWQRPYNLPQEPRVYEISDAFPRITPEQFKGDIFPSGVTKLVYHVSLRNIPYCPLSSFISATVAGQAPRFRVVGD